MTGTSSAAAATASPLDPLLPTKWRHSAASVERFFRFVAARQLLWSNRASGHPPPWTGDPVLRDWSFCNNYRELDRGTVYFHHRLRAAWTEAGIDDGGGDDAALRDALHRSVSYRLINRMETFEKWARHSGGSSIPSEAEYPAFKTFIFKWRTRIDGKKTVEKISTPKHQCGSTTLYGQTMGALRRDLPGYCKRLRAAGTDHSRAHKELMKLPGVGDFFAWQVLCDLIECRTVPTNPAAGGWCAPGPGARAGLEKIFGKAVVPVEGKGAAVVSARVECCRVLAEMHRPAMAALGVEFEFINGRSLSVKNIEHCLCEFVKYLAKRARTRYTSPAQDSGDRGQRAALRASMPDPHDRAAIAKLF